MEAAILAPLAVQRLTTVRATRWQLTARRFKAVTGVTITPAIAPNSSAAESEVDLNGNQITFNGTNSFTDTTGVTALSISGSGPVAFTYPVAQQANGTTTASANLYYRSYLVRTNFGCSGIVEYGTNTVNLVDHVVLADGSTYAFTYEGTPGATDGAVTARVASITLPAGGTISYTFSGGCSGINADGTIPSLSRVTSDGTRSYTRASVNANASQTTVQDEKENQTVLQFTVVSGNFYETDRQVYQGIAGGALLFQRYTCYTAATTPCDGQSVTPPLTEADSTISYNSGSQSLTKNVYDEYGDLIQSAQYNGSTLLEKTNTTYFYGVSSASATTDGSGNFVSGASYGYNQNSVTSTSGIPQHSGVHGQLNQTSVWAASASGTMVKLSSTQYYDTGMPVSKTTSNGTTTYSYDPTGTFLTSATYPTPSSGVSMAKSATYDIASGVPISATGVNPGQTLTVNTYDGLLRPTAVTLPSTGQIVSTRGPNSITTVQNLNLTTGENATNVVQFDAYGRTSRTAVYNGQSLNPWYQSDTCYDPTGLVKFVPTAYQSTGFGASIRCSGSGTGYQYDAMDRVTTVTTDDGIASVEYFNRAVKKTDVNSIQRIIESDLLGRISAVCEISSVALGDQTPTACGMDIAGTGYLTTYTYDLANHMVTVAQGSQQRIFQTDYMGRTVSTSEPERGVTTYSYAYNSTGLQVVRARAKANQTSPTVLTHTDNSIRYPRTGHNH